MELGSAGMSDKVVYFIFQLYYLTNVVVLGMFSNTCKVMAGYSRETCIWY